ncbi:MAG: thiamine biosynthesis protein ThiF [Planctomycetaceae bacterium]|nr:thiamine biosynthesis protein ThiF [Planctomycetaceae bacterium]
MTGDLERYSRQMLLADIGEAGQRSLLASRVLVCGCGALGSVLADSLARAGVGFLRIVDRDFVELSNLQRQVLFDEDDVARRMPKAVAAAEKLGRINSGITIEPIVADIDHTNILRFLDGIDLVVDGTDNFEVRFLVNDATLATATPWVYGGCIGSHGQTMTIFPGESACLRCLIEDVPPPGAAETCDTAGVLGAAINVVASLQTVAALKILTGHPERVDPLLTVIDVWDGTFRTMNTGDLRERTECPACVGGERVWLDGVRGTETTVLCGRDAVQVAPPPGLSLSLEDLAGRLEGNGQVTANPYLLRLVLADSDYDLTVFADGRAIVKGTQDIGVARSLYARYIGN